MKNIIQKENKMEINAKILIADENNQARHATKDTLLRKGYRNIDEARVLTEVAIFADKVAVDEETVRLRSHLDQFRSLLNQGGPIGKKLDFLVFSKS